MTTITPTQQELLTLESLRAHRRAHREVLNAQISPPIESIKSVLTCGQMSSDGSAETVG